MVVDNSKWQFRKMNKGEMNIDPIEGEFFSTEAIVAGDSHLKPEKLQATGLHFNFPDIESAIRRELSA